MFCPKCGTQNSDNSTFCEQCGSVLSTQSSQPVQPAPSVQPMQTASPINLEKPVQTADQPVRSELNAGQPVFGQQYQQPQQFQQPIGGQQPAYAAPVYSQPGAPKKSKAVPIIIAACAVVVAAFLIVLFTVIIPNNSGIRGKLRHKWSTNENGITMTYDFKKNNVSVSGLSIPISWDVTGEDHLKIEMSAFGETETQEYIFSISADGKTLTLTDPNYSSSVATLTRAD